MRLTNEEIEIRLRVERDAEERKCRQQELDEARVQQICDYMDRAASRPGFRATSTPSAFLDENRRATSQLLNESTVSRSRTLRKILDVDETDLFEPRTQDQRTSLNFHKEHRRNNVDDHTRASEWNAGRTKNIKALDRAGNRDVPYRASTTMYDRAAHHGYNPGQDPDQYDYGRGRTVGVNSTAKGLKANVPPVVTTVAESLLGIDPDELTEEQLQGLELVCENVSKKHFQAAADYVRKGIDDPDERQRAADHFAHFFSNFHPGFSHDKFHRAAGTKTREERENYGPSAMYGGRR